MPRAGVQPHRDVRQVAPVVVGLLPQPRLRAGVGEDVAAFGGADVGRHRHDGHSCDQTSGDGQHGRRGRCGEDGDPVSGGHTFGHRRRRADEVAATQHGAVDAHRVTDVGSACDGGGIEGGQQHDREVTVTALGILGAWTDPGWRRVRCTGTTG